MRKDLLYFLCLLKYNLKNARALGTSFWIGVFGMVLNNSAFFVIWHLFMRATGPINGWTSIDVFGMLGIAMFCFGITHGFFHGVVELPHIVTRGQFDTVLLSPRNILVRLSGMSFSITAFGDLVMGLGVMIWYGVARNFHISEWISLIALVILGAIVFLCVRIIASLVVFYIYDGELISNQVFELFLRPGLYPGSIFPHKMKILFMTAIPTLLTSSLAVDYLKQGQTWLVILAFLSAGFWVMLAAYLLKKSVKRYESGNFLR